MRPILCLVLLLVCGTPLALRGQDSTRSFKIKVIDKKGRPVRGAHLVFRLSSSSRMETIGGRGFSVLEKVTDADTLLLISNGFVGALPLAGLDSVALTGTRHGVLSKSADGRVNIGYQTVSAESNTVPVNRLEFKDRNQLTGYKDLASYLQGRIAGVQVKGGEVIIRGGSNSFVLSSAALIVVDGVIMDDFETANHSVNILDIESVDVLKDGSIYGSRGANGVVIITTKNSH